MTITKTMLASSYSSLMACLITSASLVNSVSTCSRLSPQLSAVSAGSAMYSCRSCSLVVRALRNSAMNLRVSSGMRRPYNRPQREAISARDERLREVVRVERAQVLERLAHADQLHGQAELVRDRDRDAALRAAVELRQRHSRDADGVVEQARLLHRVLPGRRVDDEQRLVRRAFGSRGDHSP